MVLELSLERILASQINKEEKAHNRQKLFWHPSMAYLMFELLRQPVLQSIAFTRTLTHHNQHTGGGRLFLNTFVAATVS